MTQTKPNSTKHIDLYLTKAYKGKRLSSLNEFLNSLYTEKAWRMCFFQKKPQSFQKIPDRFYLYVNSEALSSVVAKVNPSKPFPSTYSQANSVHATYNVLKDDMIVECVYSSEMYCDIEDEYAAIELLESIIE